MDLIDDSENYTLKHTSGAEFKMAHWSVGMQDQVDRECYVQDGKGGFKYLLDKERSMKVDLTVKDWKGVLFGGVEAPCTPENKRRLPVGVTLWIVREVDERAGLRMTGEEKKI